MPPKPATRNPKPETFPKLGVNIDHVATVREARHDIWPDILDAARLAVQGGADQLTIHLREDRRHIQDKDVYRLKRHITSVPINLEMAVADEIIRIALKVKPYMATLVPEKRQEITTEGGLDVVNNLKKIKNCVKRLQNAGILVSLFIDPDIAQTMASKATGARHVEFHTGSYAHHPNKAELNKIEKACKYAQKIGLTVNAGHGLTYQNVKPIARIKGMHELNIGHNIIARAIMVGMEKAVREMKKLLKTR